VEGPSFREVLQEKLGGVRFSAHAQKRLEARNIQLSESDLARIGEGMNRADSKGGRDSLILMDGLAFVVSVPNRTVVTAMNTPDSRQAVFTQIDSAVFV
jgi:flagellar operon protein